MVFSDQLIGPFGVSETEHFNYLLQANNRRDSLSVCSNSSKTLATLISARSLGKPRCQRGRPQKTVRKIAKGDCC